MLLMVFSRVQRGRAHRVWATGNASAAARLPATWSERASTASWPVWMDATVPMVTRLSLNLSLARRPAPSRCDEDSCLSSGLIYEDGSCVTPSDCPCEYRGTVYPPGHTLQEECNNW